MLSAFALKELMRGSQLVALSANRYQLFAGLWQPGDLGVLRGVAEGVAEEARTRGFASLAFARFAFLKTRTGTQDN
jgi:hypothetical protein